MKLQIRGTVPCETGAVLIDEYVPISFRAYPSPGATPHRTCQRDGRGRLVEFGIASGTGEIVAFTLLMWRGAIGNHVPGEYDADNATSGLPCIETGVFLPVAERASRAANFERPLALHIGEYEALVVVEPNLVPTESFAIDRAVFFSRDKTICAVLVRGLSYEEQGILRSLGNY